LNVGKQPFSVRAEAGPGPFLATEITGKAVLFALQNDIVFGEWKETTGGRQSMQLLGDFVSVFTEKD